MFLKPLIPPRVDQSLTDLGKEAAEEAWAPARWAEGTLGDVLQARAVHDGSRST